MVYFCFMITKAEQTRSFIIETAAHLFNKKGFSATSINDIMQATGLAKGGIYGHFDGKEEIAIEAFEYASSYILSELSSLIKAEPDARGKLTAIINYYYNYTDRSPIEGGCPLLSYSAYINNLTPGLQKAIVKAAGKMLESIAGIVEKGKKYRQVQLNVDAYAFADLFYSRIEGAIMLAKVTKSSSKLNYLLDDLKHYIDKNILILK